MSYDIRHNVEKFLVALILLLVDPIDDVLMAQPRRFLSAFASAPIARRGLILEPFQNFQVPPPSRHKKSLRIEIARRVLIQ